MTTPGADFDPFDFIDDDWVETVVAVGKELPGGELEHDGTNTSIAYRKSKPNKIVELADRLRKGRRE
jgi:hypothetical protein